MIAGSLFAGCLTLVILCGHLFLPLTEDNSVYQSMALALVRYGRLPYLGSWDQNFPGIIGIHALGIYLFGSSDLGFELITLLFQVGTAMLLYAIVRQWLSFRTSLLSASFYAVFYLRCSYFVSGQRDVFVPFFFLLGGCCLLSARGKTFRFWLYALGGLTAGYAVLIRPTYALAFAMLALIAYFQSREFRSAAFFVLAGLIPFGLFLLPYLRWPNGLHEVYDSVIRFNLDVYGKYATLELEPLSGLFKHAILFTMAIGGVVMIARRSWNILDISRSPNRREILLYFALLGAFFLSPIVMGKYGTYRFYPFFTMLIPLAALFVMGCYALFRSALSTRPAVVRWLPGISIAFVAILFLRMMNRDPIIPFLRALGSPSPYDSAQSVYIRTQGAGVMAGCNPQINAIVCSYINRRISPGARVECSTQSLNWALGHQTATRFTTLFPLCLKTPSGEYTDYQRKWRAEYVDSLKRLLPEYIILTGGPRSDYFFVDNTPINLAMSIPGFTELLQANYSVDTMIDVYTLYRRRDAVKQP